MPVPAGYKGKWWLPAKNVEIKAAFAAETEFVEGEAFSREIELIIEGITEAQLPEIKFESTKDFKQYPQKSTSYSEFSNGEPVAIQKVVNVYIPQKSGEVVLPAIKIEWFNVNKQKIEVAEVKSQKIMVKPNPYMKDTLSDNEKNNQQISAAKVSDVRGRNFSITQILSVVALTFIFGMSFGYHVFKCRQNKDAKPRCEQRKYPDFIIKKAYAEDFKSLRDALISWGTAFYSDKNITTLSDIAKASNDADFEQQIDVLIAKLYNPKDDQIWNAKTFVESYKKITKMTKQSKKNITPLPKLYE